MNLAIACGSGGYRTVFIHGVLAAFEAAGLRAQAYAGTSASTLAAAAACIGEARAIGVEYWQYGLALKQTAQNGMSDVSLTTIAEKKAFIMAGLFAAEAPRFIVPACEVITAEGAALTQSSQSRKLGRQLVLSAARRQVHDWVLANLELHLFDTLPGAKHPLTPQNFADVAYATSRMMHAWDIPATIEGRPYVDASYICSIPAIEMAQMGYKQVIAIAADPPPTLYADVFGGRVVPEQVGDSRIHIILPDTDPGPQGADFTEATETGLASVYAQGEQKGRDFLALHADLLENP